MRFFVGLSLSLLLAAVSGCGIESAPPPPEPTPPPAAEPAAEPVTEAQSLMETWNALADAERWDLPSGQAIAQQLSQSSAGVEPLLDVIADADAAPNKKIFALISVQHYLTERDVPRLIALTASENEATTRAVATHLLGLLEAPEAQARVRELVEDPEHQVMASAILVLATMNDPEGISRLPELWRDPEVRIEDKDQILLSVPEEQVREHQEMYQEALLEQEIDVRARERLATILGRVAGEEAIDVLSRAAETDVSPSVRVLARGAIDAIRARAAEAREAAEAAAEGVEEEPTAEEPAEEEVTPESL